MNPSALFKLSNGMYVVSSVKENKINAQIADVVFQVTAAPSAIAACISTKNYTHELISASKTMAVSIIAQSAAFEFIGHYGFKSGRVFDKFAGSKYKHKLGRNGCPIILDHTVAWLDTKVKQAVELGTHTLFIADVVDAEILSDEQPMTYDYYRNVIKGMSPKNAPTYQEKSK